MVRLMKFNICKEFLKKVTLRVNPRVTDPYPICICSKEFIIDFYTLGGISKN